MTRDEQFQTLLRLYAASMEHNIALRAELTISQPVGIGMEEHIKRALEEAEEALNRLEPNMIAHQLVQVALDTVGRSDINPDDYNRDDNETGPSSVILNNNLLNPYATLERIHNILFAGEFKDQDGFLITPAADRNLLEIIGTIEDVDDVELTSVQRNKLLAILNRVHDQLQDVRNILKGKGHE